MVRQRKTISLLSVGCPVLRHFRSFVETVGVPFGVRLPFPVISGATEQERLSFVKNFCGGFLEHPREHLWHRPTMRLGLDSRMSIAMSLFLFRKVLPSSEPDLLEYAKRMSTPSDEPDSGFLAFIETEVPKIFRKGWDKGRYEDACLNAVLPVKACRQAKLSDGGARMYGMEQRWNSHLDYVDEVLSLEVPFTLLPAKVISVETGGKHRIVSKSDVMANLFRPLHASMYNHLSQFSWLLRGEAKSSSFRGFNSCSGEVFVSGDYESATDNLNGHLQRRILDIILSQSTSVPKGIRESAHQMLRTVLEVSEGETFTQERGQLMGNLLSFPLLCIINYLGFRYFVGDRPVRVNGDDIVFRATAQEANRWMEGVKHCGLTLSKGKTMVNGRYFSLNSSLFKAMPKGNPHLIPMIRSTAFGYRSQDSGPETLHGRWKSFAPGFFGDRRSKLRILFLKQNRKYVLASRRSLSRGLGLNVSKAELIGANLFEREVHYLSLPDGAEKPLPVKPARLEQDRKPKGWSLRPVRRLTKEIRAKTREAGPAFVQCAWSPARDTVGMDSDEWMSEVRKTGYAWQPARIPLLKKARLLGLSTKSAGRFLRPRLHDEDLRKYQQENRLRVWLPDEFLTKAQIEARPAVASIARRDVSSQDLQEVEGEDYFHPKGLTFGTCPVVIRLSDEEQLWWGSTQSVRLFDRGGIGIGPPPFY
jgi:hypothetical protein